MQKSAIDDLRWIETELDDLSVLLLAHGKTALASQLDDVREAVQSCLIEPRSTRRARELKARGIAATIAKAKASPRLLRLPPLLHTSQDTVLE